MLSDSPVRAATSVTPRSSSAAARPRRTASARSMDCDPVRPPPVVDMMWMFPRCRIHSRHVESRRCRSDLEGMARLAAAVVGLVLVAAACGGDDDDAEGTAAPAASEAPAASDARRRLRCPRRVRRSGGHDRRQRRRRQHGARRRHGHHGGGRRRRAGHPAPRLLPQRHPRPGDRRRRRRACCQGPRLERHAQDRDVQLRAPRPSRRCSPTPSTPSFVGPNPAINAYAEVQRRGHPHRRRHHVGRRLARRQAEDINDAGRPQGQEARDAAARQHPGRRPALLARRTRASRPTPAGGGDVSIVPQDNADTLDRVQGRRRSTAPGCPSRAPPA